MASAMAGMAVLQVKQKSGTQATCQGLPLIGQKTAVDPKQQFMVELNRRFQALEARCQYLERVRVEHHRQIVFFAMEIAKLTDRRKVPPRRSKRVSGDHPGVRGR